MISFDDFRPKNVSVRLGCVGSITGQKTPSFRLLHDSHLDLISFERRAARILIFQCFHDSFFFSSILRSYGSTNS